MCCNRKLPQWLVKLECNERFVHQPATLKSLSCAQILNHKLLKTEMDKYIWKIMGKETVKILSDCYTRHYGHMWHYNYANEVSQKILDNLNNAWGYQNYDVVDKSQVNYSIDLETEAEKKIKLNKCRKRLFSSISD